MKQIITSLDIGSSTIKLIVGEIFNGCLSVLSCEETKSKGVKNGIIVNPEEALISIKEVFNKTEEILGIKLDKVIITVPSYYAEFQISEGYTTIDREDLVINGDDIVRSLQSCVYNKVASNKELISVTPLDFKIDDKDKAIDPKGKNGSKLAVRGLLSITPKKNVYSILMILDSIGISVIDLNFGGVADYYEFKTDDMDKKSGAVINIGSEKTEISIISKGVLLGVENLPYGGKNINRDISYMYDTSLGASKALKEHFALAHRRNSSTSETEEVLTKAGEFIKINQYEVSEIVYSRIKEILELSRKQINLLTKSEISFIIITGGSSELSDFDKVVEEVFGKTIPTFCVKEMGARSNKFSSALGMIKYYNEKLAFRERLAYTVDENKQNALFSKKKLSSGNILGKIYGYFFDN